MCRLYSLNDCVHKQPRALCVQRYAGSFATGSPMAAAPGWHGSVTTRPEGVTIMDHPSSQEKAKGGGHKTVLATLVQRTIHALTARKARVRPLSQCSRPRHGATAGQCVAVHQSHNPPSPPPPFPRIDYV